MGAPPKKHERTPETEEAIRTAIKAGVPREQIRRLIGVSSAHFYRVYGDILKEIPRQDRGGTEREQRIVESMALAGVPQARIAQHLGVPLRTLGDRYGEIMKRAVDHANANMVRALYHNGIEGNVSAQIFWTKAQLGWSEKQTVEMRHSGPAVQVYIPDNGRDDGQKGDRTDETPDSD